MTIKILLMLMSFVGICATSYGAAPRALHRLEKEFSRDTVSTQAREKVRWQISTFSLQAGINWYHNRGVRLEEVSLMSPSEYPGGVMLETLEQRPHNWPITLPDFFVEETYAVHVGFTEISAKPWASEIAVGFTYSPYTEMGGEYYQAGSPANTAAAWDAYMNWQGLDLVYLRRKLNNPWYTLYYGISAQYTYTSTGVVDYAEADEPLIGKVSITKPLRMFYGELIAGASVNYKGFGLKLQFESGIGKYINSKNGQVVNPFGVTAGLEYRLSSFSLNRSKAVEKAAKTIGVD